MVPKKVYEFPVNKINPLNHHKSISPLRPIRYVFTMNELDIRGGGSPISPFLKKQIMQNQTK
jgi:hypothetical protein